MHKNINNLIQIKKEIYSKNTNQNSEPKIIAVSKTFSITHIEPLINYGHIDYGENKVQEAVEKWTEIKKKNKEIKLHMIGRLQTNKVKDAIHLFDYIHSLDSIKLAKKISIEQKKIKKNLKIFIQVNIGRENQKSGIKVEDLKNFYQTCKNDYELDIIGLMCIPPVDQNPSNFFEEMKKISEKFFFKELSMGMSSDYLAAIKFNSSYLRIGTKIFNFL